MLEELAVHVVTYDEDILGSILIGVGLIGFATALIFQRRQKYELQRAPYFAISMLLYFSITMLNFIWLFSFTAMHFGVLWIVVGIVFSGIAVIMYFYGMLALARSRDAFGHGRYAILAVIPLANFVLLLQASRNAVSSNRFPTITLLSGKLGVISGFVMATVSVALGTFLGRQSNKILADAQNNPAAQSVVIDYMVRTQGVEGTLKKVVSDSHTPIVVDEVTTLTRIEAGGNRLRRTYVVNLENISLNRNFWAGIEKNICSYGPFSPLLHEGAAIEEVYVKPDGLLIGTLVVTQESCLQ